MSDLQGYVVDPLAVLTAEAVGAEVTRRGRIAYRAWVEACGRFGLNVPRRFEDLMVDEQNQWAEVYGVCEKNSRDHEAGLVDPA